MAEKKLPPLGTSAVLDNPSLANLKEREKTLVDKLASLEKADAAGFERRGFNLSEVKRRTESNLAEIRKEIAHLPK